MWQIVVRNRFFLFLLTLFLLSCGSSPEVIKIGLVAPFEGADRAIGYDIIYSARLAVREVNAQGGINGRPVALIALDDGGDVQAARETAVSLTLDPHIVAVVGHWGEETTAVVAPIYEQADILFFPITPDEVMVDIPETFQAKYEAVTPFDETPAQYAYPAYQTFQELWQLLGIMPEK